MKHLLNISLLDSLVPSVFPCLLYKMAYRVGVLMLYHQSFFFRITGPKRPPPFGEAGGTMISYPLGKSQAWSRSISCEK